MTGKFNNLSGCKYYQELIHKRLDGVITPEENRELDEHLAECEGCLEELMSLAEIRELLSETRDNPAEVPAGLFESLSRRLGDIKPAHGLQGLLANPFLANYRNLALAAASFVMVAVLTFSVGSGIFNPVDNQDYTKMAPSESKALILTNSGDTIILSGDEGDPDRYAEALDDLERAYSEASGAESDDGSEVYIFTSWPEPDNDSSH